MWARRLVHPSSPKRRRHEDSTGARTSAQARGSRVCIMLTSCGKERKDDEALELNTSESFFIR